MLSTEHQHIVKSTVPLLEAGGEALTSHFYDLLLTERADLRGMFNSAHQATGAQARALAGGVLMYAKHIDRLEALGELAGRVVNKHVSLQVQPEHYPVVGEYLLRSIREVLGPDVATPAVIDAWGAAYGQLADMLIAAERDMYATQAATEGGWRGFRPFRVAARIVESAEIVSFHLAPVDGGPVMRHAPGQYIAIQVTVDGAPLRRNYSLSEVSDGTRYRISVKRDPGGVVSGFLHDHVNVGDIVELTAPAGVFQLRDAGRPLVLIAGGVGQTPLMAMLEAAVAQGTRDIRYLHFVRNPEVQAFRERVEQLAAAHPRVRFGFFYDEDPSVPDGLPPGRVSSNVLRDMLPPDRDADVYLVGPGAFMASVLQLLGELGVPPDRCITEFFGPHQEMAIG
ncbi:NO-inducible flavohemoprotein [Cupriavidus plantarum]|uniref:NO-inducible flavohemoprotein n=1 Tax=Cupriavidus plantarum TaxID=942865 RepID=UPI00339D62FA